MSHFRWRDRGPKTTSCDGHHNGDRRGGARLLVVGRSLSPGSCRKKECTMNRASLNYVFFLFGVVLTTVSGSRLGNIVGVTWEFAAFAAGIVLWATCAAWLQTKKRIDDLEKKVSELENTRKVQA
jgi:hypothetical protein